jgi:hypothetical protein
MIEQSAEGWPAPFLSRRSFLEHVPALLVLPACLRIRAEVRGEDGEASRESPRRPNAACAACSECTARFCRYQAGGQEAEGLGSIIT